MMEWITIASGKFPEERRIVQVIGDFATCGNLYAYLEHGEWYWQKTEEKVEIPLLAWGDSGEQKKYKIRRRTTKELGHLPDMPIVVRIQNPETNEIQNCEVDSLKVSLDENGKRCLCIIPYVA